MAEAGKAGVTITTVGKFGGADVTFGSANAPLSELTDLFRSAFQNAVG